MTNHYEPYIRHMLSHYVKQPTSAKTEADKVNLQCVKTVMVKRTEYDQSMIDEIFGYGDPSDNARRLSRERNIALPTVWMIVNNISKEIALERGLI